MALARLLLSFFEVKCPPATVCASQVEHFGLNHDGVYHPESEDIPPRVKEAYEEGCPVLRGNKIAFSTRSFESGPQSLCNDSSKCQCLLLTDDISNAVEHGSELRTGMFMTPPRQSCNVCSSLSNDKEECEECSQCEYTTRSLEGRKTLGCFSCDQACEERREKQHHDTTQGRPIKGSAKLAMTDKQLIPHYSLYDPGAPDDGIHPIVKGLPGSIPDQHPETDLAKFRPPWEIHRERLSAKRFLEQYSDAAFRTQMYLDKLVDATKALASKHLDCAQDDPIGLLERLDAARRACKATQAAQHALTGDRGPKLEFPIEKEHVVVNCMQREGINDNRCVRLNCYGEKANPDLQKAWMDVSLKGKDCASKARTDEESKEIKGAEANGEIAAEVEESSVPFAIALSVPSAPPPSRRPPPGARGHQCSCRRSCPVSSTSLGSRSRAGASSSSSSSPVLLRTFLCAPP